MRAIRRLQLRGVCGVCLALVSMSASAAETEWHVWAYPGEPFGVGRIGADLDEKIPADRPFVFHEQDQRVFYPVVKRELRDKKTTVNRLDVYFLFRGDKPLRLQLPGKPSRELTITPQANTDARRDLLETWWKHYPSQFLRQKKWHREPETLGTYLTAMLSRRLDLPNEDAHRRSSWSQSTGVFGNDWSSFAELIIGTQAVKAALQRDTLLRESTTVEIANSPLPEGMTLPAVDIPGDFVSRDVEELAYHVPEECFYIRCAGVPEYRWLRQALDQLQTFSQGVDGVISDYTIESGIDAKLERQLGIRESTAAIALGPKVLSQMAVIGTDFFVREGAAIGVVFEAKNTNAVREWVKKEQAHTLKMEPHAKLTPLRFGEIHGTLLSTPDNRVRSIHVVVGDYHLVTNSKTIARRFTEISKTAGSLGALKEYQYTRAMKFPDERIGPVFVYLSDAFFRNFISPQYRIEMTRRAKAAAELELVALAQLAAKAEGIPAESVADLVSAELLPPSILARSDHSQPTIQDGELVDSERGVRGNFLPIPDVELSKATRSEVEGYEKFRAFYRRLWTRVDPVALAITEQPSDKPNATRLVFDLYVTPLAMGQYTFLAAFLPNSDQVRISPSTESWLFLDVVAPFLERVKEDSDNNLHLFAGLSDFEPPFTIANGEIEYAPTDESKIPGYFGQTHKAGLMRFFIPDNELRKVTRDANGYGLHEKRWLRVWNDDWLAVSNQKHVLEQATPQLKLESALRPAQLRCYVGDLSQSKIRRSIEAGAYVETRRMSADTARYMLRLMQQFHIEPEGLEKSVQQLHDGRLLDPLSGQFQWNVDPQIPGWVSTHWANRSRFDDQSVPHGFSHPFLSGMHGALMELSINRRERSLSSHFELTLPAAAGLRRQHRD